MPDPIIVESLDLIPEPLAPLKSLFKEHADGGFVFELPKGEDVSGLKSSKAKIERELKTLKPQFEALRSLLKTDDGEDLSEDDIREALSLRSEAKKGNGNGKGALTEDDIKKLIQAARAEEAKKHEKTATELKTEKERLASTLDRVLIVDGIRAACSDADLPFRLRKGASELLIKAAKADGTFRVVEDEAVVWDYEKDQPRVGKDGEAMKAGEWIAEQVSGAYSFLVEDSTGSGATQSQARTSVKEKLAKDMSEDEKRAYQKEKGFGAWKDKLLRERGFQKSAA